MDNVVYVVYGWDSMASSMGDTYLAGIFTSKALAQQHCDKLNRERGTGTGFEAEPFAVLLDAPILEQP